MESNRGYWKSKTFRRILALYMALIPLFGCVLTISLYVRSARTENEQSRLRQDTAAARIADSIDEELEKLRSFADQLKLSKWIIRARSTSDILFQSLDIPRQQEISRDILLYQTLLTSATGLGVRIPSRGLTITGRGWRGDAALAFDMRTYMTAENVAEFLARIDSSVSFSASNLRGMTLEDDDLLIVVPLEDRVSSSGARAVLYCCLSGEKLLSSLAQNTEYIPNTIEVFLCGELILSYGMPRHNTRYVELKRGDDLFVRIAFTDMQGVPVLCLWKEVVLPTIVVCLISLAVAYTVSLLIYRPIRSLRVDLVDSHSMPDSGISADDLDQIQKVYRQAISENETLRHLSNELVIRNRSLEEILHTTKASPAPDDFADLALIEYVNSHISDSQLSLSQLAEHFGSAPSGISRRFRQEAGINFSEYVSRLRIEKAKKILRSGAPTSFEIIATTTGYGCERTFRRVFKTITGYTPTEYCQLIDVKQLD